MLSLHERPVSHSTAPSRAPHRRDQTVGNPQLVADSTDDEIDQVVELARPVIPAWHGREYDSPGAGELQHILEMDQAERRFTRDHDQLAALLEMHVGGASDQVGGHAVSDRARVLMLQGMITMPPVRNDPLAIPAEKFR